MTLKLFLSLFDGVITGYCFLLFYLWMKLLGREGTLNMCSSFLFDFLGFGNAIDGVIEPLLLVLLVLRVSMLCFTII